MGRPGKVAPAEEMSIFYRARDNSQLYKTKGLLMLYTTELFQRGSFVTFFDCAGNVVIVQCTRKSILSVLPEGLLGYGL